MIAQLWMFRGRLCIAVYWFSGLISRSPLSCRIMSMVALKRHACNFAISRTLSAADDVCLDFRVCEGFQQIASEEVEVWYLRRASSLDPHSLLRSCSLLPGSRSSCKRAPHFYWPAAPCCCRKQTWITRVGSLQILSWKSSEGDFLFCWVPTQ